MLRRVRLALGVLLLATIALFVSGGLSPATAADTTITGTLSTPGGEAVVGVLVTATDADGVLTSGTSDDKGIFVVPLPAGGTYLVEVDITTLPEGISLNNAEDASRSLLVLGGEKRLLSRRKKKRFRAHHDVILGAGRFARCCRYLRYRNSCVKLTRPLNDLSAKMPYFVM